MDPAEAVGYSTPEIFTRGPFTEELADLALECAANALAEKEDNRFSVLQRQKKSLGTLQADQMEGL